MDNINREVPLRNQCKMINMKWSMDHIDRKGGKEEDGKG